MGSKIMVEMVEGVFQYVTLIDNRKPISLSNIGYSIYPNRAMSGEFIDQVRALFDDRHDFKFKLVDDKGRDIKNSDSEPEIVWTNCADRMPPDNQEKIIIISGGEIMDSTGEAMKQIGELTYIGNVSWTEFTPRIWEYLNNGQ
ncbi:MAG: hypothetical protein K2Q45_11000 [Nitrosomonas sp.]|nr:hypothetical protein [Nitrosomonas sp.]